MCNHWGGEDAYDQERAEQRQQAVDELQSDKLDRMRPILLKKYQNHPPVLRVIKKSITLTD